RVSPRLRRRRAPRPDYSSLYKRALPTVRTDRAADAVVFRRGPPGDTMGPRGPRARAGLVERLDHDRPAGLCRDRRPLADSKLWSQWRRRRRRTHDGADARIDLRGLARL